MTIDQEEEFKVQEINKLNHIFNTRFSNKELYNKEIKAAEKEKCDTKNNEINHEKQEMKEILNSDEKNI